MQSQGPRGAGTPSARTPTRPGLQSFWGPCCNAPPRLCPLWGEIKVQTVVPLWAEAPGRGVAPGCKALAEEALGGLTSFPRPCPQTLPRRPSTAGCLGDTQLCPSGPLGAPIFLRGAQQ